MTRLRPPKGQRLAGFVSDSRPMPLQLLAGGVSIGSILTSATARERDTLAAAKREREGARRRQSSIGRAVQNEYRARMSAVGRG